MKIEKKYLAAEEYQLKSFRLGRMIIDSGWVPDDMIALWRGGAPVGVIIHEFLHYHGFRPRHRALKCQSYTGIKAHTPDIFFENADEIFNSIIPGSKVLIVDDIFDTGKTAQAVAQRLAPFNLDLKFAMVFWKPEQNQTDMHPDFHVVKTDQWIVFPHELDGLTTQDVKQKHPAIYNLLVMERLKKGNIDE